MRYLEWLFPICRHARLRREVSFRRVLVNIAVIVVAAYVVLGVFAWAEFVDAGYPHWGGRGAGYYGPPPVRGVKELAYDFWLFSRRTVIELSVVWGSVLLLTWVLELIVALQFVRTRPGRRRPLCTWRTVKAVLLGSRTWAWLVVALVPAGWGLSALMGMAHRFEIPLLGVGVVLFVGAPVILMGAIAIQAAEVVIALQDDRRCKNCGYFLIGLSTPRCPECGQPFDPARLDSLAGGAQATEPVVAAAGEKK